MKCLEVSKISCIVDSRLSSLVDTELERLGISESYGMKAKQMTLSEHSALFSIARHMVIEEDRADLFRFYVPREYEEAVMDSVASAADLYLPGRGSIFAEHTTLEGNNPDPWRVDLKDHLPASKGTRSPVYELIHCIVKRGDGDALARMALDMGFCVPIISYGQGMGLRNKLGLLRITIPVDKEIIWFLVPEGDVDFVLDAVIRKAGMDQPGQGFIYRSPVRVRAVNTRMMRDKRRHVASMEQVISALDEIRGSTDWRRLHGTPRARRSKTVLGKTSLISFTLICEEGSVEESVRVAMEKGAGGATLVRLSRRGTATSAMPSTAKVAESKFVSRARETCDLIVERTLVAKLEEAVASSGFFDPPVNGFLELGHVADVVAWSGA
jgi:nitrogen regulatory protein PII